MSAPSRGGFLVVVSVALASDDIGEDDDADDDDGDFSPSNKVAISSPSTGEAMISPLERPPRLDGLVLIGIANPMPSASRRIAALMAMTSENSFTNGPPLLPGLIAQSV